MKPGYNMDSLPGSLPPDLIPRDVNVESVQELAQRTLETGSLDSNALQTTALWRDHLALTGQVRTFYSNEKIVEIWNNRAKSSHLSDFKTKAARVMRPVPNSSWIDVTFEFTTKPEGGLVGNCTGAVSFVPDKDGKWVIWMLVTILENFADHGHPDVPRLGKNAIANGETNEQVNGHANGQANDEANGVQAHEKDSDIDHDFDVVVIGAGQCGLSVAGRLDALGLRYVLLEKRPSLGKNWIGRYETVRQHTVREYNNLPFARTWKPDDPILLPGKIVAEGFENYVKKYGINLWTNAETTSATWAPESRAWTLNVSLNGQEQRKLRCRHLIISVGAGFGVDNDPKIPGTDEYQGILMHSGAYKHSRDWVTKDGIVIGSGTMAHDIAEDMYRAGLRSVHMIQRSKTCVYPIEWVIKGQSGVFNNDIPTAVADAMSAGVPNKISRDIVKVQYDTATAAESYRFDALERAGFRVDRTTPLMDNILMRYGGYYVDIGASAHIVRGEIKVKSGVPITNFTPHGLKFQDGSELRADVVVIATGQDHDYRNQVGEIVGRDYASRLGEFWGLDEEGEVRNIMKPAAPGLWMFGGTAPQARWWSRFVALAIQSDILGKPIECVKQVG
ncbi:hypothetical protein A1O7_04232 [Cladophialophora yegresii CBS 114405]|uniref:FAD/NAD(P)-binding domain-containing protein n=1 Tax=Cladophialophora yegresii CBS 114405 TaxID=1182544 RepID=W9VW68_9EURO|nr:uncharacterized protein A1O7_04232 [Cladophialophora yegresii CBS 114405]EXJ60082.1 hypothetical protein A1O7_04232 [Cladophialophora yegresii CBS 114405]